MLACSRPHFLFFTFPPLFLRSPSFFTFPPLFYVPPSFLGGQSLGLVSLGLVVGRIFFSVEFPFLVSLTLVLFFLCTGHGTPDWALTVMHVGQV